MGICKSFIKKIFTNNAYNEVKYLGYKYNEIPSQKTFAAKRCRIDFREWNDMHVDTYT